MNDLKVSELKHFAALLIVCSIFICLPFFCAKFIPSTDLPQHLAQIRLLEDIFKNPLQSEYTIEWFGANSLVYYLIEFNWKIFNPLLAGKLMVLEIAIAWVLSIFALAWHKQRSEFSAAIACVFIFNSSLYWGFLNFLIGLPVFVLWYLFIVDPRKKRKPAIDFVLIILISCLLFLAHTLWLLIAVMQLAVAMIHRRPTLMEIGVRFIALVPVGLYSLIWFPKLESIRTTLRFDTAAHWLVSPIERLDPRWLLNSLLGGLHGLVEFLIIGGIVFWISLSLRTNWGQLHLQVDREFFFMGILLTLVVFFAPDKYINTIYFASRWAPLAMIFFLLALPSPCVPKIFNAVGSLVLLTILSFTTSYIWHRFETTENSGLEESLNAISNNKRVIGLDFTQNSALICGRPFLQTFAYAQVMHGGKLNFSFAEHHSGIVSYAKLDTVLRWTPGLEWEAQQVRYRDFYQFDYALIHGSEAIHKYSTGLPMLTPVTTDGSWRLYRCNNNENR